MRPFFELGPVTDARYRILRDDDLPIVAEGRAFVEELWRLSQDYLDSDLPSAAKHDYLPRFWEMYVCACVLRGGMAPVPRAARTPRSSGPDLLLASPKVWVEAVLPTSGSGPDSPPSPTIRGVYWVPEDQLKLRFRQAIEEKHGRYNAYLAEGWVHPEDPFVIAVGGAGVHSARYEVTIPRIVRCVLPIGHEQVHVDRETLEVVGRSFAHQASIVKSTGGLVSTDLFLTPAYSTISGVLYDWVDEINRPSQVGSTSVFIHNPSATNPVPLGTFRFGWEYWVVGEQLNSRCHEPGQSLAGGQARD